MSLAVAKEAPIAVVCVIMRVGLTRVYQWNLETDEWTPGQFVKADAEVIDISPDGKYFSYVAYSHYRKVNRYACVAKPPYFTALAFFPTDESRSGITFEDGNELVVSSQNLSWLEDRIESDCPFTITRSAEPLRPVSHSTRDPRTGRQLIGYGNRIFSRSPDGFDEVIKEFEYEEFELLEPPDWAKVW
ncbi:MAG TPA: hypothetical protein VK171_06635 [Fimbriimonas sp.]|nr:hypothetical protein [Fimbriimonas sp.]